MGWVGGGQRENGAGPATARQPVGGWVGGVRSWESLRGGGGGGGGGKGGGGEGVGGGGGGVGGGGGGGGGGGRARGIGN
eukprot:COSAG06_NODE_1423_length_9499_cov_65.511967_2_plen_79_part_00